MSIKKFPSEFDTIDRLGGEEYIPVARRKNEEMKRVSLSDIKEYVQRSSPVIPAEAERVTLGYTPTIITTNTANNILVSNQTEGAILSLPFLDVESKSVNIYAEDGATDFLIHVYNEEAELVSTYNIYAGDLYTALFTNGEWEVIKVEEPSMQERMDDLHESLKQLSSYIPNEASSINKLADKAFVNSTVQTAVADKVDEATFNAHVSSNEQEHTRINSAIQGINGKIPSQATAENQLADKSFVNSSVQTATANFRGNWDNFASIPTDSGSYPADYAGSTTPTVNDYLVVQDASDKAVTGNIIKGVLAFDVDIDTETGEETQTSPMQGQRHSTDYIKVDGGSSLSVAFPEERNQVMVGLYFAFHFYDSGKNWIECGDEFDIAYYSMMSDYNRTVAIPQVARYVRVTFHLIDEMSVFGQSYLVGTWRFKYSGEWGADGRNGWLAEYQVNETPLTAAQLATLNSNMTEALTQSFRNHLDPVGFGVHHFENYAEKQSIKGKQNALIVKNGLAISHNVATQDNVTYDEIKLPDVALDGNTQQQSVVDFSVSSNLGGNGQFSAYLQNDDAEQAWKFGTSNGAGQGYWQSINLPSGINFSQFLDCEVHAVVKSNNAKQFGLAFSNNDNPIARNYAVYKDTAADYSDVNFGLVSSFPKQNGSLQTALSFVMNTGSASDYFHVRKVYLSKGSANGDYALVASVEIVDGEPKITYGWKKLQ